MTKTDKTDWKELSERLESAIEVLQSIVYQAIGHAGHPDCPFCEVLMSATDDPVM